VKVLFRSPLSTQSGYGNDGIGMAMGLINKGIDLRLMPFHVGPPLPSRLVERMLHPVEGPFDFYINHSDPGNFEVGHAARKTSDITLGWTMWEYTTLQNMSREGRHRLAESMTELDVFVSYDAVTHQAAEHFMGVLEQLPEKHPYHLKKRPTHVVAQGGYIPGDWRPPVGDEDQRNWSDEGPFRFCMVGQLHVRKDPMVAISAFKALKDEMGPEFEDAELHLKTNIAGLHPLMEEWCPKLRIHYASWPQEILKQFYYHMNVLLAPSRGEGKNMPALEMLSTAGSVIATNWGGHTTWMDPLYAYPLDYTLAPEPPFEECMSARASVEHLKELMWHCYTHRSEVKAKGEQGAQLIPRRQNWDTATADMLRIVSDAHPEGDKIKMLLAIARRESSHE
jgi:glycosyltransferase involved in cell wall biosynthesis